MPRASWWGGFFEISVKLTKKCLRKVLGNARLTCEELETLLIEIEGVLNSRPLTYVYDELDEQPLTLSSLFIGRRLLDPVELRDIDVLILSKPALLKRDQNLRTLLKHFWSRWKWEYLTSLWEFHRNKTGEDLHVIRVGDIVYWQEDKVQRQQWNMAKVEKLLPGKDGIVRAAVVRTIDKAKRPVSLKRTIRQLYPLEVTSDAHELNQLDVKSEDDSKDIPICHVADEDVQKIIV